jgi:hypothetical protein
LMQRIVMQHTEHAVAVSASKKQEEVSPLE